MDAFLVPVGRRRFELYAETPESPPDVDAGASGGLWRRMKARFRAVLDEVERHRAVPEVGPGTGSATGFAARLRGRVLRWTAERIAEQRLLWHLRGLAEARLHYPDDQSEDDARRQLRTLLKRDRDRHLVWLVFNCTLFILSGVLAALPGPNLVAYYFAFRSVGHLLSLQGTRQGLSTTTWTCHPSAPLTRLARALSVPASGRDTEVSAVARELALKHLVRFYRQTAVDA